MTERRARGPTGGTARRFFLVERYVPSMSADDIDAATVRLDGMADAETRHLGTLLIPGEDTCLSLFEAPEQVAAETMNDRAGFAHHRIVEVQLFVAAVCRERGGIARGTRVQAGS